MTGTRREKLLQELFEVMSETLELKGGDYANKDVLSNFKYAGQICNISSEIQCLSLIATKVSRLGVLLQNKHDPNNESVQDSVIDLINYGFLLFCLLSEKNNE